MRELRNGIESAVVMARGSMITAADLPPHIREESGSAYVRLPVGNVPWRRRKRR